MKQLLFALVLSAAFFTHSAVGDVIYEFTGTSISPIPGTGGTFSFTYTAPDFITSDITAFPSAVLECTPPCQRVQLLPSHPSTPENSNEVAFTEVGGFGATYLFYFLPGAFQTIGTHQTFLLPGVNDGTLTVSVPGEVPEPGTAMLFVAGLIPAVLFLRRSRRYR